MKKIGLILIAVGLAFTALAEFRIWTDLNGNFLEAEFVGTSGKNIVLKKRDGKQLSLSPMKLSKEDREYLKGKVPDDLIDESKSALDREKPPRLDVEVTKKTATDKHYDEIHRQVTCIVKIKKLSAKSYSRKLKAELFVFGIDKQHDYYVMLDRKAFDFDFALSDQVELSGEVTRIRYYQSSDYGIEYKGNLVVIRDDEGNVLEVVGSSKKFEKAHEKFVDFKRNDVFSEDFQKKGTRSSLGYFYADE